MTDDYKIILNCVRKLMKNKWEKEAGKGPNLKIKFLTLSPQVYTRKHLDLDSKCFYDGSESLWQTF